MGLVTRRLPGFKVIAGVIIFGARLNHLDQLGPHTIYLRQGQASVFIRGVKTGYMLSVKSHKIGRDPGKGEGRSVIGECAFFKLR